MRFKLGLHSIRASLTGSDFPVYTILPQNAERFSMEVVDAPDYYAALDILRNWLVAWDNLHPLARIAQPESGSPDQSTWTPEEIALDQTIAAARQLLAGKEDV